ncbi:unnamed protein product [Urochloa humidicola]
MLRFYAHMGTRKYGNDAAWRWVVTHNLKFHCCARKKKQRKKEAMVRWWHNGTEKLHVIFGLPILNDIMRSSLILLLLIMKDMSTLPGHVLGGFYLHLCLGFWTIRRLKVVSTYFFHPFTFLGMNISSI